MPSLSLLFWLQQLVVAWSAKALEAFPHLWSPGCSPQVVNRYHLAAVEVRRLHPVAPSSAAWGERRAPKDTGATNVAVSVSVRAVIR